MKEDSGLWLVEGVVSTDKQRQKVWKRYEKQRDQLYKKRRKIEQAADKALASLYKQEKSLLMPFTPWVGRVDTGANPKFVEDGKKEYYRRLREHQG